MDKNGNFYLLKAVRLIAESSCSFLIFVASEHFYHNFDYMVYLILAVLQSLIVVS